MNARRASRRVACMVHAWLVVAAAFVIGSTVAPPAHAQAQATPVMELSVESTTVGLGEPFDVQLVAQAAEMPRFPELELPRGLVASRPSVSTSTNVSIINGVRIDRLGLEVHWRVQASETGSFTIGPASVRVGDRVLTSRRVTVRVVREVPRDARRSRQPSIWDPFGMFGGRGMIDPFGEPKPAEIFEPETDPSLALAAAPAPGVFLLGKVDKAAAIVGEQVTHTVLLYADTRLADPQFSDLHEAPAPSFLRQSLLDDAQPPKLLGLARVGEELFRVYLLRKVALFPLAPGALPIGPMRLKWQGARGGDRGSTPLTVRVAEAPLKGRPPGYVAGSVGTFTLVAEVAPRAVDSGGTFVVKATVEGRGQPPPRLGLPEVSGFAWLDPDVQDAFAADDQGRWAGRRVFTWAVRATAPGQKNLGKLAIVAFDPERRAYARAEADLGAVQVAPGAVPVPAAPVERRGLEGLPAPLPGALEPAVAPLVTRMPRALFAAPVALALAVPVAAAIAAIAGAARARLRAVRERKPSLARVLRDLEAEAKRAEPATLEGLTARAVEAFGEAAAKRSVRGLRDDELRVVLAEALGTEGASRVAALLAEARDARFSGLTSAADARRRFDEVLALVRRHAGSLGA